MKKYSLTIIGIILIVIGIILCGNFFSLWNVNLLFDGWWCLFIIVPSFCGLLKKEWVPSLLGLTIGTLLLLQTRNIIDWSMVYKVFLPFSLILFGVSLIFAKVKINNSDTSNYIAIFSENKTIIDESFIGSTCVSLFGKVDLDLRKAKISEDTVITCISIFGETNILLPDNVKIKTSGAPIFGGIDDKHTSVDGPIVEINYVCIFGGISLK